MCVNKREITQKREISSFCSGIGDTMRQEEYGTWRAYEGPVVKHSRLAASKRAVREMEVETLKRGMEQSMPRDARKCWMIQGNR